MEAAGIEPASTKDLIKASTDIFCFKYRFQKQKQTKLLKPPDFKSHP